MKQAQNTLAAIKPAKYQHRTVSLILCNSKNLAQS